MSARRVYEAMESIPERGICAGDFLIVHESGALKLVRDIGPAEALEPEWTADERVLLVRGIEAPTLRSIRGGRA